tara:strand:+ start:107 stop:622 length:516 start_codon:yes stop_codon:yes gene_type:complete
MDELGMTGIGVILFIFLVTLVLGASKKVVIYYNYTDAFISFLSGLLVIGGTAAYFASKTDPSIDPLMAQGAAAIGVLLSIKCIIDAGKYNKSHAFGWLIGTLKVISSLLLAVLFIGALQKMFGKQKGNFIMNIVVGVIMLGLFGWMLRKLVNGPEVYANKGWELPSKSAKA